MFAGLTPVTFLVTFGAGLLTSLSPCTLSVLPLTIGYIGGYSGSDAGTDKPSVVPRCGSRWQVAALQCRNAAQLHTCHTWMLIGQPKRLIILH